MSNCMGLFRRRAKPPKLFIVPADVFDSPMRFVAEDEPQYKTVWCARCKWYVQRPHSHVR